MTLKAKSLSGCRLETHSIKIIRVKTLVFVFSATHSIQTYNCSTMNRTVKKLVDV